MDYGSRSSVDKFTTCSKEDFDAFYNRMIETYGSFCFTSGKMWYILYNGMKWKYTVYIF